MNTKTLNKENGIFMGVEPVGGNDMFDAGLANAILSYLKNQNVKKIADFGCGHGQYTFFFEKENLKCDGFDGNPDTPKITKNKCKVLDLTKKFVSESFFCLRFHSTYICNCRRLTLFQSGTRDSDLMADLRRCSTANVISRLD